MKLFYCILAYNDPKLLSRTINILNDENSYFVLHIQKSVSLELFSEIKESPHVIFIRDRIETIWGDVSCIKAAFKCFEKAIELNTGGEDAYCVLMSGSDYPVKSKRYIYNYFKANYPTDYYSFGRRYDASGIFKIQLNDNIKNWWWSFPCTKIKIEVAPYKYIRPRCFRHTNCDFNVLRAIVKKIPCFVKAFFTKKKLPDLDWGGSETWMQLSFGTVRWIISFFRDNPDYWKVGSYMHNPEEILIQSILNTKRHFKVSPTLVDTNARSIIGGGVRFD